MDFTQRMLARLTLHRMLTDMPGEQFEGLVQQLLGLLHPDFVPVRTHGNLGDMGADGLLLWDRTLLASYSPQTEDTNKIKTKFRSDLKKALDKRNDSFDTFRFVINDLKGVHPELSVLMSEAQEALRPRRVEHYGWHRLWNDVMRLDRSAAEDLLGRELPVQEKTFGIGLTDLEPLLRRLSEQRRTAEPLAAIRDVNQHKIEYNELGEDVRGELFEGLRRSHLVDQYYANVLAVDEHDQVAQGLRVYYEQVRSRTDDDEVLWSELQQYILGNAAVTCGATKCASIVIAHFFERCDVFDVPPDSWAPAPAEGSGP